MLAISCRCVVACSVAVSLTGVPARAQSLSTPRPSEGAVATPAAGLPDTTSPGPSSSFTGLFKATLTDFTRIPSRENLVIAGLGGLAASMSRPLDRSVSRGLSGSRELGEMFAPGEFLGSAGVQMASAMATQIVGRVSGNRELTAIGADLVRAQIVTQTLTAGIKLAVRRTRPDGTQYSFPSGHASTTFATATVLQRHLGWKAGVPAYALATYVATSRVQVKRHFLSDVAMGATLGVIAGRSVTIGRGQTRFALGPSVVPGGAGVNFTLVGRR